MLHILNTCKKYLYLFISVFNFPKTCQWMYFMFPITQYIITLYAVKQSYFIATYSIYLIRSVELRALV